GAGSVGELVCVGLGVGFVIGFGVATGAADGGGALATALVDGRAGGVGAAALLPPTASAVAVTTTIAAPARERATAGRMPPVVLRKMLIVGPYLSANTRAVWVLTGYEGSPRGLLQRNRVVSAI
ncbi:MAG TPA: hypothetical protein VFY18_07755, partial [Candidatus Limnocylindrales bacterium]|nr:hypothetical protein [Candidatus Limnocylindrales bacterium]